MDLWSSLIIQIITNPVILLLIMKQKHYKFDFVVTSLVCCPEVRSQILQLWTHNYYQTNTTYLQVEILNQIKRTVIGSSWKLGRTGDTSLSSISTVLLNFLEIKKCYSTLSIWLTIITMSLLSFIHDSSAITPKSCRQDFLTTTSRDFHSLLVVVSRW